MSVDPLALASEDRHELQRLLKENRELRQANALLRVSAEAKGSRGNGGVKGAAEKGRDNAGTSEESVGSKATAASVRRLKDELQRAREALERARREQAAALEEHKQIKSLFEAFVVEACEREEACRRVFARVYEEVGEQQKLCEGLRRQLQERPPTAPAPAPRPRPRHQHRPPPPPSSSPALTPPRCTTSWRACAPRSASWSTAWATAGTPAAAAPPPRHA
ncbi:uncharacterized protein Tco025E_08174 [Trypanosoma conorhini]|uniref:Uncharacterized protein n=1 Tax=Trypanosoma conorhini TaxID=83891 RepID=A0A3R7K8D6_9TRYP|nr:uncharacterized protein Tco025E_08174 [Trypanosoma conorhini]RNF03442.1 hypothetical protein Tco025E_08174 [Trypanosoma conorhini]